MGEYADEIEGRAYAAGYCPPGPDRCRHELIKDQCGLCTPRVRPVPSFFPDDPFGSAADHVPFRNMGPGAWFPAQFPGECDGCGSGFDEDDDIRADGSGGWEGRCCE